MTNLLTASHIRELAAALDKRPTKTLGQNFVHDGQTVRKIVAEAGVTAHSHVLEIGSGLGSLTLGLLETGACVSAVEIDPVLAHALPATVKGLQGEEAASGLRVLLQDALRLDGVEDFSTAEGCDSFTCSGSEPDILVANLPYNVAVPIVLRVLEKFPSITRALVMVQHEVAQRMCAKPGSKIYGVPSVKLAWFGVCAQGSKVSRNIFWPVPHVDSSLVHFSRYSSADDTSAASVSVADGVRVLAEDISREDFYAVVEAAFSQRRKTLRSALAQWAGSPAAAQAVCEKARVQATLRGEQLSAEDFLALARAYREESASHSSGM